MVLYVWSVGLQNDCEFFFVFFFITAIIFHIFHLLKQIPTCINHSLSDANFGVNELL
jgi:hypothetical protein